MSRIAILGAGVSGLSAARALVAHGHEVILFDKSRGVGGRMSTRYAGEYEFDHGAQYFTVSDPKFRADIEQAVAANVAAPWSCRAVYERNGERIQDTGRPRFVGTSRMNAVPKFWAQGLNIVLGQRAASVSAMRSITFEDGTSDSGFDVLISTIPPAQAQLVLPKAFNKFDDIVSAKMSANFTLMLGLPAPVDPGFDTLRCNTGPIGWIAKNDAKPSRSQAVGTLIVQSSPAWSDENTETDRDGVTQTLLDQGSELCGIDLHDAPHQALHRWLYASNKTSPEVSCLIDPDLKIIACGDWCLGGRVEGAWLSGYAAAQAALDML